MSWNLKNAEKAREEITQEIQRKIRNAYNDVYKDVASRAKSLSGRNDVREAEAILLEQEISERVRGIDREIELGIVSGMSRVSNAVVDDTVEQLRQRGFREAELNAAFIHVPEDVVRNILSGKVYGDGWSFSSAIWGHNKDFNNRLSELVGKGIAEGKSAQEIAKDLEQFVNPNLKSSSHRIKFDEYLRDANGNFILDENGNRVRSGRTDSFYFGNIDYNAQRLARTLVSHAYQQSFERTYAKNPFVTEYVWHSSGQHGRTCEICLERDGMHFKKDELPLDHPNGMCWFEAYSPYSDEDILDMMVSWYNSPWGTYPEIDEFVKDFSKNT